MEELLKEILIELQSINKKLDALTSSSSIDDIIHQIESAIDDTLSEALK